MIPNRNMALSTSHTRGPPESPWKQKKIHTNTFRCVFLTVWWIYFHLPRAKRHIHQSLVKTSGLPGKHRPPSLYQLRTPCFQWPHPCCNTSDNHSGKKALLEPVSDIESTQSHLKKQIKSKDELHYIDVQSDKMALLKCPATFFAIFFRDTAQYSTVCHVIDLLCGHTMLSSYLVVIGKRSLLLFSDMLSSLTYSVCHLTDLMSSIACNFTVVSRGKHVPERGKTCGSHRFCPLCTLSIAVHYLQKS